MAVSINWATSIINIPKSYLTALGGEVYEMNVNQFRLDLKDLEDNEAGITFQKTHNHNPEISIAGVLIARVVNILPPYTITFEDGQYAVNLIGANNNISEKVNVNQVSVRSSNSAGLVSMNAVNDSIAATGVSIDEILAILQPPVANVLVHKAISASSATFTVSSPQAQLETQAVYGTLKYWTGAQWDVAPLRVYVSGAFTQKNLYLWDGQNWRPVTTG
jgi:hypothetical protein